MVRTGKAGHLQVEIFENREALGHKAGDDAALALNQVIREKGRCNVIFAAAPSQNEFLEQLCHSDVDWSKVHAFHMDEYIGLPSDAPQGFGNFLRRAIFSKVPFASVEYLNGGAEDIDEEIERYSKQLQENPVDIVFMGIGENAHIAFNDPAFSHFDDVHLVQRVKLDETCRTQQVHDGCFQNLMEVPHEALTLTVPALVGAERIFCMVPAATKAAAVEKVVLGEIRETVPASILRMHQNAVMYVDSDSGRKLLEDGFGSPVEEHEC